MTSSEGKPAIPSLPASPPLQNESPTKSTGSQSSSYFDSAPRTGEPFRPGTSSGRHTVEAVASSSKGKERQKRLSDAVPRRPQDQELVQEGEPWEAKNILSFDGGGIRGLYSLSILRLLMEQIKLYEETFSDGKGVVSPAPSSFHPLDEPLNVSHLPPPSPRQDDEQRQTNGHYLPCHYFDYICGTSTGGLIAIMLSRLRMTAGDCIDEYEKLAGSVFGKARVFHQIYLPTAWLKRPKYDATNLENVIKGVTKRRGEDRPNQDGNLFKTGRDMCRTFVFAHRQEGHYDHQKSGPLIDVPYVFRSYDHFTQKLNGLPPSYLRNPGSASDYPVWKVARATTAAPMYFAPMQVYFDDEIPLLGGSFFRRTFTFHQTAATETSRPVTFIDGGLGPANNPSKEAFDEVTTANERIGTFVSIGTARGSANKFERGVLRFIKAGIAAAGDPEPPHKDVLKESQHEEHGFSYFRFNEHDGLPDLEFDEWKPRSTGKRTQQKIREAFQRWALDPRVTASIQKCALELVRRRRLRTADESQWERYAIKAYFDCNENSCPQKGDKRWYNRNDFRDHLMKDHKMTEGLDLENAIRSHGRAWRYKPKGNGGIT